MVIVMFSTANFVDRKAETAAVLRELAAKIEKGVRSDDVRYAGVPIGTFTFGESPEKVDAIQELMEAVRNG